MDKAIQQKVVEIASHIENKVDAEIDKLENITIEDIDKLREHRLKEMRKMLQQQQVWIHQGHGEYSELSDEKEFFKVCKKSDKVVCHFYKNGTERCSIVDMHLKLICAKHLETRFVKLNVEKAPFLTERLKIKIIPTIALIVDSKARDYIVGFTDLGNCDDFSTEVLEWRIAHGGAIRYNGDLLHPPDNRKMPKKPEPSTRSIRQMVPIYYDEEDFDSD